MNIYLIRHGQDLNPDPDRLTNADPSLSEIGKEQALKCALKLQAELGTGVRPKVFASPRKRTMETARIVAEHLGIDTEAIKADDRLRERDCDTYAGQSIKDVFSLSEAQLTAGGMEPYASLYERSRTFCNELLSMVDAPIVIISHSGNVRAFIQVAKHYPPESNIDLEQLDADAFIKLQ